MPRVDASLTPTVAAALAVTGSIPTSDLPMLAAQWLSGGRDSPALRELAGLAPGDRSAAGLWPTVLQELRVPGWAAEQPCAVIAPWAARQVRYGNAGAQWLVDLLRAVDPGLRAHTEQLDLFLAAIDRALETIALPLARRAADHPVVLARARTDLDRWTWYLTLGERDEHVPPVPGLPRDPDHVAAAARAVQADLRRVTRSRWVIAPQPEGVLRVDDETVEIGSEVDEEAVPAWAEPHEVDQALADEAVEAVWAPVAHLLLDRGLRVRCRRHGGEPTPCSGVWVCNRSAGHDLGVVGRLRARDVTVD